MHFSQTRRPNGYFEAETKQVLDECNLSADEDFIRQLAYDHIIWHEMGHGLQAAYSMAMPIKSQNPRPDAFPTPSYHRLETRTLEQGVSSPIVAGLSSSDTETVEAERFAEGLSHQLLLDELVSRGYVAPENSVLQQLIRDKLKQMWVDSEAYEKATAIIANFDAQFGSAAFRETLKAQNSSVNVLGYATAHDPATIELILKLTP